MGLANKLASPQIVLPWVYSLLGGPLFLIGLLIPSVRMGSLIAQMTVVPSLLIRPFRKKAFVGASFAIASMLLLICLSALQTNQFVAASIFFICLFGIGACNGISTLSSQEVMAKSMPKRRVGPVLALQGSIGGLLTLILLVVLHFTDTDTESKLQHLLFIFMAAGVWILTGLTFSLIKEPASKIQAKKSVWQETVEGWHLFRSTAWFRRFFVTRALFLSVGLAMPFYAIHAAMEIKADTDGMSIAVLATAITSMLAGPLLARFLSKSIKGVMISAGLFAAFAGVVAILHNTIGLLPTTIIFGFVFAILDIAVQGLTQGSKAYLAIKCPEADRPRFLAINNVLLGVAGVLVSFFIGVLAHSTHIIVSLIILIALALTASLSALNLPPLPDNPHPPVELE